MDMEARCIKDQSHIILVMPPLRAAEIRHYLIYALLTKKMRARLEWSNVEILSSILLLLDTQSWLTTEHTEETSRMTEIKSAAPNSLTDVFRAPLEAKGVDLSLTVDEIGDIVDYVRT